MSEIAVVVQRIPGGGQIDPITVYWEQFSPGKGQVTIICFGSAWTSYWGGMGDQTIHQFFCGCGNDYLVNKLTDTAWQKRKKTHEKYLARICDAIKCAPSETLVGYTERP